MEGFERASRVDAKPIDWLIDGLIPRGMFSVIAGRPGEGKSTLECWITAEVTRQGGSVILSNQEDPIDAVVVPRLEAAGALMKRVHLAKEPIRIPSGLPALERRMMQTGAQLVIFDAAQQHLEVPVGNGQRIRQATTPLKQMLERTGAAAILIDHVKKNVGGNGHPLEALVGAGSGLAAAARLVYLFGTNPKNPDERALVTAKSNIGRHRSLTFELMDREIVLAPKGAKTLSMTIGQMILLDPQAKVTAQEVLRWNGGKNGNGNGADSSAKAIAGEWLIALLMGGPRLVSELQDEAGQSGISWATVRRAGDEAKVEKKRHGFGKGGHWEWELPGDHPAVALAAQARQLMGQTQLDDEEVEDE